MKLRFVLSQTWMNLRRNGAMIVSVMLVAFVSFLFVGASAMFQSQIVNAKATGMTKLKSSYGCARTEQASLSAVRPANRPASRKS